MQSTLADPRSRKMVQQGYPHEKTVLIEITQCLGCIENPSITSDFLQGVLQDDGRTSIRVFRAVVYLFDVDGAYMLPFYNGCECRYSIPAIIHRRLLDRGGQFFVWSFWTIIVSGLLLMINSVTPALAFDLRWLAILGAAAAILLIGFAAYALRVWHLTK